MEYCDMTDGQLRHMCERMRCSKKRKLAALRELELRGLTARIICKSSRMPAKGAVVYDGAKEREIARRMKLGHAKLIEEGATIDRVSDSGSRYYTLADGSKLRLADHAPNEATAQWMERVDCISWRADREIGWTLRIGE